MIVAVSQANTALHLLIIFFWLTVRHEQKGQEPSHTQGCHNGNGQNERRIDKRAKDSGKERGGIQRGGAQRERGGSCGCCHVHDVQLRQWRHHLQW